MVFQAAKQCPVVRARRCRLVKHNDIETRQALLLMPERLSDKPLQAVSSARQPAIFLGDSEPESWLVRAIWPVQNSKHFVAAA